MKAHATVVFTAELTGLTEVEAKLIWSAIQLVSKLDKEDAEELTVSEEQIKLAKKMLPEIQDAFRESNWRE